MDAGADVAKQVADLLLDQGVKISPAVAQLIMVLFEGFGGITSVSLGQVVDKIKENKDLKQLMDMEGEISAEKLTDIVKRFSENSLSVNVADRDAKEFDELLKEQGVLFAKADRKDDNCKLYMYLNRDRDKVENATQILQARRGLATELNAKLYFNNLSPDKVHVVEGLSAVELELFRHYARKDGLLFTTISRKEGEMIVCSVEDEKKARKALLYTGWALTGPNGARVREQVEYRLAGRTAINIAAEEGSKELYIVSRNDPGSFVHISADDFVVYKHNKQIGAGSRNDPDYYAKCLSSCDALAHPVILTQEQFQFGVTAEELEQAPSIDLFPVFYEDMVEIDQINRLTNLVARKAALDDEGNATWGIHDPSVSYSAFASYENIMDAEEREAREYEFEHFKQAALYSQQNHTSYDVSMKEKSVDYIIARAEAQRRQQSGEPERPVYVER